jgi:hypothetical protein
MDQKSVNPKSPSEGGGNQDGVHPVRTPVVVVRAVQNHTVRVTQHPAIVMRAVQADAGRRELTYS